MWSQAVRFWLCLCAVLLVWSAPAWADDVKAKAMYEKTLGAYQRELLSFSIATRDAREQKVAIRKLGKLSMKYQLAFRKVMAEKSHRWTICALYRMAEVKLKVAQAAAAMPAPTSGREWSPKAHKIFRDKLGATLILPLLSQAVLMFTKALWSGKRWKLKHSCMKWCHQSLVWVSKVRKKEDFKAIAEWKAKE